MAAKRTLMIKSSLIYVAIGLSVIATAILVAFPGKLIAWQIGSWTLVFALLALLILVLVSAYSLATDRAARTWQRILSFSLGLACLAALAVGSL